MIMKEDILRFIRNHDDLKLTITLDRETIDKKSLCEILEVFNIEVQASIATTKQFLTEYKEAQNAS